MRLSKVRAILATGVVVGLAAPTALAGGLPKVPVAPGHLGKSGFKVRPPSIEISGDASFYFDGHKKPHNRAAPLKWTSWSASSGSGRGFNWVNNCMPNCAAGTFHEYPVTLKVSRPKRVEGHLIFTRMTVTYTKGRPGTAHHKTVVYKVTHSKGGNFFWSY